MELSVLIVDDDKRTRSDLGRLLDQKGYQVATFSEGADLVQTIEDLDFPVVALVDVDMPGMNGVDVLLRIDRIQREHPERFIVPFAMSGKHTESQDILKAKRSGARDFLAKPIVPEELFILLNNADEALTRARERQEALSKDDLTDFYRQKQGLERLAEEISRTRRFDRSVGFVFIDLDDFKKVNDTYGHQVGDELLRWLAIRIKEVKRSYDVGIRYGGDEFALILPETDKDQSEKEAKRIWGHLSKNPFILHGNAIRVTVSMGVAVGVGLSVTELVRRADVALYKAKREGKNRVCVFSEDPEKMAETVQFPKSGAPPA